MSDTAGDVTQLRREYVSQGIADNTLAADPFKQFTEWFDVACKVRPDDATSMTLATANKQGMPSARIVLLKHFDANGFAWYTDYESQKGKQLQENPQAEILFYWYGLERQIRIQGRVEKLTVDQADIYFHQRPLGSQLSAEQDSIKQQASLLKSAKFKKDIASAEGLKGLAKEADKTLGVRSKAIGERQKKIDEAIKQVAKDFEAGFL